MTMDPFEMLNTGPLRCFQEGTYTVQFLVKKCPYNTDLFRTPSYCFVWCQYECPVLVGYTKVPAQPKRNFEEHLNMKGKKRPYSNKTPK